MPSGDEVSYEFVLVTCSSGAMEFHQRVLQKALEAAKKHEIPADASSYCAAHVQQEMVRAVAERRPPDNPALRGQIERLYKADQAVRQKADYDAKKMSDVDRENENALRLIVARYGVPTYRMVGAQAASDFVVMIQHQPPEFRRPLLPGLKANVDAGQADPEAYAMVFDRLQTDAGGREMYGENLICDRQHPKLHLAPIEDENQVNERRAAIGLMRLNLYVQAVIENSPDVCPEGTSR